VLSLNSVPSMDFSSGICSGPGEGSSLENSLSPTANAFLWRQVLRTSGAG
jgi:hypothetical protein